jgi:2-oxo-4-hydroxy-4-carboxy--5-ureidoimidazoline (OHCU) decarboxylase
VTRLQEIDTRVQALAQKVQDWLAGKTAGGTTTSTTDDSSLDQAAAGLGKLTKQAGDNG